jgi:hypothetical protein
MSAYTFDTDTVPYNPDDLAEAPDHMPCCTSAGYTMFEHCTCWEPIFITPQQPVVAPPYEITVMEAMCADCAYRPGSLERRNDEHTMGSETDLLHCVATAPRSGATTASQDCSAGPTQLPCTASHTRTPTTPTNLT